MSVERMIQAAVARADLAVCGAGHYILAGAILLAGLMVLVLVAGSRH